MPVALAAGDEAACGKGCVAVGRRRAAVGHSQGLAPRDAEDAARLRFFVIAQHMAVQIHGDVALDLQPLGDGDVVRQLHDAVRAGPDGGAEGVRRGGLCRRAPQRQMEGRFLLDVIVQQRAIL